MRRDIFIGVNDSVDLTHRGVDFAESGGEILDFPFIDGDVS